MFSLDPNLLLIVLAIVISIYLLFYTVIKINTGKLEQSISYLLENKNKPVDEAEVEVFIKFCNLHQQGKAGYEAIDLIKSKYGDNGLLFGHLALLIALLREDKLKSINIKDFPSSF